MSRTDKEMMLDDIIKRYGFESETTIDFAYLIENGTDRDIVDTWTDLLV